MVEKRICESNFEKQYLGLTDDEAIVVEKGTPEVCKPIRSKTLEDVLAEYRLYMGDPKAELPQEILDDLNKMGKA
jgi:hypothetical protein